MAEITKNGTPTLTTQVPNPSNQLPAHPIGEDIVAGDACYISQSDGKIYRSDGSSGGVLGGSAEVDGFAPNSAKLTTQRNPTISLYHDVNMNYATGLTPGKFLYLSTTVLGGLTDVVGTKQVKVLGRTMGDGARVRLKTTY